MPEQLNLLTHTEALNKLAVTEGIIHHDIETGVDSNVAFERDKATEKVKVRLKGGSFDVTDEGLTQAAVCVGIPNTYSRKCPEDLLMQNLNFWYSGGGGAAKLRLFFRDNHLIGAYKNHPDYYSNNRLLADAMEAVGNDHIKGFHQVSTNLKYSRLSIVTDKTFSPMDNDTLYGGISIQNSIFGSRKLEITPYIFRQICSNGAIMSESLSQWKRTSDGKEDVDAWVKNSTTKAIEGLDTEFQRIKHLTEVNVAERVDTTLKSIFQHFHIPTRTQLLIEEEVGKSNGGAGAKTLYDVWNGLTRVATHNSDLSATASHDLQLIAGDMVREDNICPQCRQLI